jgi:hypothetical protein
MPPNRSDARLVSRPTVPFQADFQAFIAYLNLHVLFSSKNAKMLPATKAAGMEVPDEDQHRLGGVYASSAERYLSDREEQGESQSELAFDSLHLGAAFRLQGNSDNEQS